MMFMIWLVLTMGACYCCGRGDAVRKQQLPGASGWYKYAGIMSLAGVGMSVLLVFTGP